MENCNRFDMMIHENEVVANAAVQTIIGMQLGLTDSDIEHSLKVCEEKEMYEEAAGIVIGQRYFYDKTFNCKVSRIMLTRDQEEDYGFDY